MNAKITKMMFVVAAFVGVSSISSLQAKAVVHFYHSDSCGYCHKMNDFLAGLQKTSSFKLEKHDVAQAGVSEKMTEEIKARHVSYDGGVPVVIVGDHAWIGFGENARAGIEAEIAKENAAQK
jgi:glutaredoxin